MNNAEKFKSVFGIYATELWAMPEKDFLKWLNAERNILDVLMILESAKDKNGQIPMSLVRQVFIRQPEIIRCKDCRHFNNPHSEAVGECTFHNDCFLPNDFCSRAERGEQ